jgi:hypothetical protein
MNEVAGITRRLIEGLGDKYACVPVWVGKAFEDERAMGIARGRIKKRIEDPEADVPVGYGVIMRYLGQGDPAPVLKRRDSATILQLRLGPCSAYLGCMPRSWSATSL